MNKIREQIRDLLLESEVVKNLHDFYFERVEDGLYLKKMNISHALMFGSGSGSELFDKGDKKAKARAIDSSSMLSYNFFSGISDSSPLYIDNVEYNSVYFEVRLKTLVTSNAPANIDVVLVDRSRKNVLFIESKFLEYLENSKCDMSDSYSNLECYYKSNSDREELKTLVNLYCGEKGNKHGYYGGIKQNICHLVAISNLVDSNAIRYAREKNVPELADIFQSGVKYKFINLIFDPSNNLTPAANKYEDYKNLLGDFEKRLEKDGLARFLTHKGIAMPYSKLFASLKELRCNDKRCDYLEKRYMHCSNKQNNC